MANIFKKLIRKIKGKPKNQLPTMDRAAQQRQMPTPVVSGSLQNRMSPPGMGNNWQTPAAFPPRMEHHAAPAIQSNTPGFLHPDMMPVMRQSHGSLNPEGLARFRGGMGARINQSNESFANGTGAGRYSGALVNLGLRSTAGESSRGIKEFRGNSFHNLTDATNEYMRQLVFNVGEEKASRILADERIFEELFEKPKYYDPNNPSEVTSRKNPQDEHSAKIGKDMLSMFFDSIENSESSQMYLNSMVNEVKRANVFGGSDLNALFYVISDTFLKVGGVSSFAGSPDGHAMMTNQNGEMTATGQMALYGSKLATHVANFHGGDAESNMNDYWNGSIHYRAVKEYYDERARRLAAIMGYL